MNRKNTYQMHKQLLILMFSLTFSNLLGQPTFTVNKSPAEYCMGDTIAFSNTTPSGTFTYLHWNFGDNSDTYVVNPKHIYLKAGTYQVILSAMIGGTLQNSQPFTITVFEKSILTLVQNTTATKLTASANPDNNISYTWYFGNKVLSETSSSYIYQTKGTYSVAIKNDKGCKDSSSINITDGSGSVSDSLQIVVKNNILTPEIKDGLNDMLFIEDFDKYSKPIEIYIYNRVGILVYNNKNYSNFDGFEGKSNDGKLLNAGTYYYTIRSSGRKGKTGYVDIIR
jgi:gliding motility-associated-like protein